MQKLIALTFFMLFFHACGEVSQHEPREEKTLYFSDTLPVNGIEYYCGERRGVTKTYSENQIEKHGLLKCVYSPLTFKLGSLTLGAIENMSNQETFYPQNLISNFNGDFNNEKVLKISILLQSLDDKSSTEYINISKETKDKITLTTLDNLSIVELNKVIKELGFTPVSKEDAKIHLILNSPNSQSGKPSIQPFEEEISLDLTIGNIIGELDIDKGDGELIFPFILEGKGKEHFLLNNKGKLILIESFSSKETYELNVTATNEFGYTTVPMKVYVKNSSKIGKAQMGRLKGATVKLFKLLPYGKKELMSTEITNTQGTLNIIGNFDLHTELIEDQSFYVYEVSEGIDIDSDDNGEVDETSKKNHGMLHLISKGIWIKSANQKIRITPLSEMLYTYVERNKFENLDKQLSYYSKLLLKASLNTENEINTKDVMLFNPLKHKRFLSPTLSYNNTYNNITQQIRMGNSIYRTSLFNAYIIESFQSNAIEIVGSSIYTIDMLNSGEFRIYDLETQELIGKLKLPNTPVEDDTHTLYVNRLVGEVRIASLSDWSYEIFIHNQSKPLLDGEPFMKELLISGSFSRTTLGTNFFGQEKQVHLYHPNKTENETQIIKFLNVDKNNVFYQFEFDSKLTNIESLWVNHNYLYVVGDEKIHIFQETNNEANLSKIYTKESVNGNIIGIEENILYILQKDILTLYDISSPLNPQKLDAFKVPFVYKMGIKTNEKYITTGSKIFDITALRASKTSK